MIGFSWHDYQKNNIGKISVKYCIQNHINCSLSPITMHQTEREILQFLSIVQPDNRYNCTAVVVSYHTESASWITVPCNKKFYASFGCDPIAVMSSAISSINTSTTFKFVTSNSSIFLSSPQVNCPKQWFPIDQTCMKLHLVKRPQKR